LKFDGEDVDEEQQKKEKEEFEALLT